MAVIHWFRRDLRLSANSALNAALRSGEQVVPLFILDPALIHSPYVGSPRLAFMLEALRALDAALCEKGGRLLVRYGKPAEVLPQLVRELGASAVYANLDYSPYAKWRDEAVVRALTMPLKTFQDVVIRAPGTVMKNDGDPYTVYTPFMRKWRDQPAPPRPEKLPIPDGVLHTLKGIENPGIPDLHDLVGHHATIGVPRAGEARAQHLLSAFVSGPIYAYGYLRNSLVSDPFAADPPEGTSYLSPYLRFGMLSPLQAYWAAQDARDAAPDGESAEAVDAWVNELIWRDFYVHILYHFPHVLRGNFRPEYNDLQWRESKDDLQAWQNGYTGYPIVDAAMRQLKMIGWMPNRARMVVASFLTKDLLIHWQAGERHFMQWLLDGDPAANNGGWQWAAGTGTDAQPYFRIFNPVSQSQKYDPQGAYIRHWIPELRGVPAKFIHAPWTMDNLPDGYPLPIIDHGVARARTLAAFKAARE